MGHRIIRALWGDLRGEELKKFIFLALGFFFLIGSYWPLKTLKDSIFLATVGSRFQPEAKVLSLLLFLPIVLFYSRLIDHFSKEKMIYLLVAVYSALGILFVYFMKHPTIGLANPLQSPTRLLGWGFYLYVESYISLMVSLYWAFINDVTTPESAKKGYGVVIFGAQFGGTIFILLGNWLSRDASRYQESIPLIASISIFFFLAIALVVFTLTHFVSKKEMAGYQEKEEEHSTEEEPTPVGFFEGLRLLLKCKYVGGIFGLVFFHEVISAIMYYQMYVLVEKTFCKDPGLMNKYLFSFSLMVQAVACIFGLLGTSFFQRRFGIRFCLVAYPLLLGASIVWYGFCPHLYVITGVMIIAKSINYALNQPAKEGLYIPTSKAIKYKSKAWIDMFGLRSAKGAGAAINKVIGMFTRSSAIASLIIVALWTFLSHIVGRKYQTVIANKELIK
jgi:ATP:ADP antiporter, AAA family